jgi:hypothetical protein
VLNRENEVNPERPPAPGDVGKKVVCAGELPKELVDLVDHDGESRNTNRILNRGDTLPNELGLTSTKFCAQSRNCARDIRGGQIRECREVMGQCTKRTQRRTALEVNSDKLEFRRREASGPLNDKRGERIGFSGARPARDKYVRGVRRQRNV